MVALFHERPTSGGGGYALGELIIASSIFCSVSMGLLMGFTSLERNYTAATDFSQNHADEMRISDYRAIGSSVRVHYYLMAGTIYRQQDSATPTPLAVNVQDFVFNVSDAGKVVTTRITFNPTFNSDRKSVV